MTTLPDRFRRHLCTTGLLPSGSSVVAAVSGGADSVALLHLLHSVSTFLGLRLAVAHLDHALRPDSYADAGFVRELCSRLSLPLVVERIDVATLLCSRRGGLEEVAREVRRDFLQRAAVDTGCQWIALGHQRDDQAETFLLRLLRGAGTAGLAGMRALSPPFVRPLLPFSRVELVAWLTAEGLSWREDPSNRDRTLTRNRVRHELLPLLESFNPAISRGLAEVCRQLGDDEAHWSALVDPVLRQAEHLPDGSLRLPRVVLADLSPAVAGRLVRALLQEVRGDLRRIEAGHVAAVLALAASRRPQGEVRLPGAWVGRRYESLLLRRTAPPSITQSTVIIATPGCYSLADGRLLTVTLGREGDGGGEGAVEFCATATPFPLSVRAPRPGERLAPDGMSGRKKLQDLFIDLKVPVEQRRAAALLCCGDDLLWVIGLRRAAGRRPLLGAAVLRVRLDRVPPPAQSP